MNNNPRPGCKDMWNAFMVRGAEFSPNDIPLCPTTAKALPKDIITYSEAVTIYRKKIREDARFHDDSFVCFYEDDRRFDGRDGIWFSPRRACSILSHFEGIVPPRTSPPISISLCR